MCILRLEKQTSINTIFSAAVLLLLLMMGVNYGYLYQKQSRAVEEKIRIYGIGEGKNALIKVII